jgi:tRNA(Ile2) C34 agmatinyltransferase TiaS
METKTSKHGVKIFKCPICGDEIHPGGQGGHMRIKHGKKIPNKGKLVETAIETSVWADPMFAPRHLAEFILRLFGNDEKELIKTIKEVKKEQNDD